MQVYYLMGDDPSDKISAPSATIIDVWDNGTGFEHATPVNFEDGDFSSGRDF